MKLLTVRYLPVLQVQVKWYLNRKVKFAGQENRKWNTEQYMEGSVYVSRRERERREKGDWERCRKAEGKGGGMVTINNGSLLKRRKHLTSAARVFFSLDLQTRLAEIFIDSDLHNSIFNFTLLLLWQHFLNLPPDKENIRPRNVKENFRHELEMFRSIFLCT